MDNFLPMPRWYKVIGDASTCDMPPERVYDLSLAPRRGSTHVALTIIYQPSGEIHDVVPSSHLTDAGLFVSTIFMGVDHNFAENGPPILWETVPRIRHKWLSELRHRYTSRRAAIQGHIDIVRFLSDMVKHMQPDTDAVAYLQAARFDYDWREHASEDGAE